MLSKCLNPQCTAKFHYLWEGRLFRFDFSEARRRQSADGWGVRTNSAKGPERSVEHFWLCSACAASMTVELSEAGEVRLVPIEHGERKPAASAAPMCNLVAHAS
jgi:hypothetical protein